MHPFLQSAPQPHGHQLLAELLAGLLTTAADEVAGGREPTSRANTRVQGLPPPMVPNYQHMRASLCLQLVRPLHLCSFQGTALTAWRRLAARWLPATACLACNVLRLLPRACFLLCRATSPASAATSRPSPAGLLHPPAAAVVCARLSIEQHAAPFKHSCSHHPSAVVVPPSLPFHIYPLVACWVDPCTGRPPGLPAAGGAAAPL